MPIKVNKGRKIAVIVNGDNEPRHIKNVQRAVQSLKKGGYQIYVASPVKPAGLDSKDRHVAPTRSKIKRMIAGIRSTNKDYIVSYSTGHGAEDGGVCTANGCSRDMLKAIDAMKYKYRTVVMDTCYGGNNADMFMDDPRTLFISAGVKGKQVCCNDFAPKFWDAARNIKDTNPDNAKAWRERFEHAQVGHHDKARCFLMTNDYSDYDVESGKHAKPEFAAKPMVEANSVSEYEKQIKRLKPGQYAALAFSASWCGACPAYKKKFKQQATQGKGKQLFIWSNSSAMARKFGINIYPSVIIIDAFGNTYKIKNRNKIHARLRTLSLNEFRMAMSFLKKFKFNTYYAHDLEFRNALSTLSSNPKDLNRTNLKEALAILKREIGRSRFSKHAIMVYKRLIPWIGPSDAPAEVAEIRKLINSGTKSAIEIYQEAIKSLPVSKVEAEMTALLQHNNKSHASYSTNELKTLGQVFYYLFTKLDPERQRAWVSKINIAPNTAIGIIARGKIGIWTDNTSFNKLVRTLRGNITGTSMGGDKETATIISLLELSSRLTLNERAKLSKDMRSWFFQTGSMHGMEDAYAAMARDFNRSQNEAIVSHWIKVQSINDPHEAIYGMINSHIDNLKGPIILKLETMIRNTLDKVYSSKTRRFMLRLYTKLAPFVSKASARDAAKRILILFYKRDPLVYRAYAALAPKLSDRDKFNALMFLSNAPSLSNVTGLHRNVLITSLDIIKSMESFNQGIALISFLKHLNSRNTVVRSDSAELLISNILLIDQANRSIVAKKLFKTVEASLNNWQGQRAIVPAYTLSKIIHSLPPLHVRHYLNTLRILYGQHIKHGTKSMMIRFMYRASIERCVDEKTSEHEFNRLMTESGLKPSYRPFAAQFLGQIALRLGPQKIRMAIKHLLPMIKRVDSSEILPALMSLASLHAHLSAEEMKSVKGKILSLIKKTWINDTSKRKLVVAYRNMFNGLNVAELRGAKHTLKAFLNSRSIFVKAAARDALKDLSSRFKDLQRFRRSSLEMDSAMNMVMPDPLRVPVDVP